MNKLPSDKFRAPTNRERAVFDALLGTPFPGREEIEAQLLSALVRTIDEEGSVEIKTTIDARATVQHRIPVEAFAKDKDGVAVHALIHVVDGIAKELEFYKDDSSRIIEFPIEWEVMRT